MIKPNSDQAKEDKTDQQKKIKQINACYFTIRFETACHMATQNWYMLFYILEEYFDSYFMACFIFVCLFLHLILTHLKFIHTLQWVYLFLWLVTNQLSPHLNC